MNIFTFFSVQTGCPAYFRLKLIQSGVALQIVALNVKHNHPLEPSTEGVILSGIKLTAFFCFIYCRNMNLVEESLKSKEVLK